MGDRLRKVIDKIAKEHDYKDGNVEIKTVSTDGANYTSTLYSIKITAPNKPDLNLFAKEALRVEHLRNQLPLPFQNEILFYSKILKIFDNIQNKHGLLPKDKLKIPKFYGFDSTYLEEIIVLEDMIAAGYESFDRFKIVDWNYASAAIKELVKFQALSIAYYEENPNDFNKNFGSLQSGILISQVFMPLIQKSIAQTLILLKEENKEKFQNYIENVDYPKLFQKSYSTLKRTAFMHLDFRPSNLMHIVQNDVSYEFVVMDFQTFQAGSPVIDLLYFILMSTDEEFRKENLEKLLEYYYEELGLALKRLDVDINVVYPKEDFRFEWKEMLPIGLIMSVAVLPMITVDPKDAPVFDNTNNIDFKVNSMYAKRINGVINDYVKWGVL